MVPGSRDVPDGRAPAADPQDLARLIAVSAKYGYWLGSPEENSAAGIYLPELAGDGDVNK